MSLDEQKALSRRHILLWQDGNTDRIDDIFSPDYINHQESDVEPGEGPRNLDAFKQLVQAYHSAFSDSKVDVLLQVAENDHVATRWQITAVDTGNYMGMGDATNKRMAWTGVLIDRHQDGKIVETWVDWDMYRFFQGLNLIKA